MFYRFTAAICTAAMAAGDTLVRAASAVTSGGMVGCAVVGWWQWWGVPWWGDGSGEMEGWCGGVPVVG